MHRESATHAEYRPIRDPLIPFAFVITISAGANMSGPLSGLRVIEMGGLGAAPYAAMLLADMGADVVRVDRPNSAPADPQNYLMHRGRRSIIVDVRNPEGRDVVLKLAETADVIIENLRPGLMERLGLGPAECQARNPKIVFGRMTGWGQDGPLSQTAGHDINYIAVSGILSCVARENERPVPPISFLGDFAGGGSFLVNGILAALWETSRSGKGQVVDAAMLDGAAVMSTMIHGFLLQGRWQDRAGVNFADGGSNYYDTYVCKDGKYLAVGAIEGPFYDELVALLGLDKTQLPHRGSAENWPELKKRFASVIATRTRDEWSDVFATSDACVAPVMTLTEAPNHPHNKARSVFVENGGHVQPAPAPRFDRTPSALHRTPPTPGADTVEILRELGLSDESVDALCASGAVVNVAN